MRVDVPRARLRALVTGEAVTLPQAPDLEIGATIALVDGGDETGLKPAYGRWGHTPVDGEWTATVVALLDADALDPASFASRHVLDHHPLGTVAVLRVSGSAGPVLSDTAFEARARSAS